MDVDVDYHNYLRRSRVPAFGTWEYCSNDAVVVDDLPFTQCFESATARHPGGFYPLYTTAYSNEDGLYVTGDLYQNNVATPAVILVSRSRGKGKGKRHGIDEKKKKKNWMECEAAVKVVESETTRKIAKAVDEDLYRISPEILHAKGKRLQKRKKAAGLFSCCCG